MVVALAEFYEGDLAITVRVQSAEHLTELRHKLLDEARLVQLFNLLVLGGLLEALFNDDRSDNLSGDNGLR